MADAGRDLISAINSLATEIERGIFVAQGIAAPTIGNLEEDRARAMQRCQQAIAMLQAGGTIARSARRDLGRDAPPRRHARARAAAGQVAPRLRRALTPSPPQ